MKKTRINFFSGTFLLALYLIFILTNSCKNEGVPADQMPTIPFADVQQVYSDYCIECHSGGDLDFTSYDGIKNTVTPFNSSKSESYQAMTSTFQRMPPNNVVPTNKRTLIRLWIDQGANP